MTTTTGTTPEVITILSTGFSVPESSSGPRVAYRGEVIEITPLFREATVDRFGSSWLDYDEATQREKWGEVRFTHGAPAEGEEIEAWQDDDVAREFARAAALEDASLLPTQKLREEAREAIREKFGRQVDGRRWSRWLPGA